jgi:hypothetical protein
MARVSDGLRNITLTGGVGEIDKVRHRKAYRTWCISIGARSLSKARGLSGVPLSARP